jgi:PAS domain S-box-containing protein
MPLPHADFRSLFEAAPGLYLVLYPDLRIAAVSDAYLQATMTKRKEILGRHLFEVFPDNPDDPTADGVSNLRASLDHVLKRQSEHTMAVQKYDIRREDGSFEERFWSPRNKPVFGSDGELVYIIHRVEDVTEFVRLQEAQDRKDQQTDELHERIRKMEAEIYKRAQEIQRLNGALEQQVGDRTRELRENRDWTRATLDKMLEGIQIISPDWKYLYVNETVARQGLTTVEGLTGKTMMEAYPGIEKTPLFEALERCMKEQRPDFFLNEFDFPDKSKSWFELSIRPVPEGIFILSIDVTERKRAELKVQEQQKRFKALIENSFDGILLDDGKGRIVYQSPSVEKMIGWQVEEVERKPLISLVHEDDAQKWQAKQQDAIAHPGEPVYIVCRFLHKSGRACWMEGTLLSLLHDPAVQALVLNFRDISERLEAEERILEMNRDLEKKVKQRTAQLEAVNKDLESFSYSVSHDLRAPLRAVSGYAEMLAEDLAPHIGEEGMRLIGVIRENALRMGTLIDDLLAFSRLGRKEIQRTMVDMNELTEGVMRELGRSVAHRAEIRVGTLGSIQADYGLMHQVVYNLLSNAVKYSSKTEQPTVEVSAKKEQEFMVYTIKDNGTGFDMRYADKLFGVFQRLHSQEEFEGTGVGLAIVNRIVKRHGGKVWADSKPGEGAVFNFSIPSV